MFKTLELPGGFAPLAPYQGFALDPLGALSGSQTPRPIILHPPISNSWLRPCTGIEYSIGTYCNFLNGFNFSLSGLVGINVHFIISQKHNIPVSAIPCLYYRREKEREAKEKAEKDTSGSSSTGCNGETSSKNQLNSFTVIISKSHLTNCLLCLIN